MTEQPIVIPDVRSMSHFENIINGQGDNNNTDYIVFDFYATWCPPCRRIGPRLPELVNAFPNASFYKVDRDHCLDVHMACSVQKIPTFIVYDTLPKEPVGRLQHSDYDTVHQFLYDTMSNEEF